MKCTFLAVVVALALTGCGGSDTPTAPASPLSGTWTGTTTSIPYGVVGSVRATLTQAGSHVSGTYSVTSVNGTNSGSASGTFTGTSIAMTLTPSVPTTCPSKVNATLVGNALSGTYATFNCTVADSGPFYISK